MAQEDISKYLGDDTIFNKISKHFIKMDADDKKNNNQLLKPIFDKLTDAMKNQSPLFNKYFEKITWAGSYYKGTRYGQPEEYDLNFVIKLPFKEEDIEFMTEDHPGYTKIYYKNWQYFSNTNPQIYRELNSFIDKQSYLNQEKFRTWMEGILNKVARDTGGENRIILDGYAPISIRKTGPAFTLKFHLNSGKIIDIDVVPVLAFSTRTLPSRCSSRMESLRFYSADRRWSVVPKPLNNSRGRFDDPPHRYWRLCFYEFEKDMLCNHDYGRVKPIIRQLKKFRDTQKWKSISSYYLETLCYHELEMFHTYHGRSLTFLFFTMLEKLRDAFHDCRIRFYWDDDHNLLENIGFKEMRNMEDRIEKILKSIKKTIKEDKYAIAKWILSEDELNILKHSPILRYEPEPEPEPEPYQWSCMIA